MIPVVKPQLFLRRRFQIPAFYYGKSLLSVMVGISVDYFEISYRRAKKLSSFNAKYSNSNRTRHDDGFFTASQEAG
jgi:hypothetical protein